MSDLDDVRMRRQRSILAEEVADRTYWLDRAVTWEAVGDADGAEMAFALALDADRAVQYAQAVLDSLATMREYRAQVDFRLACAQ